MRMWMARRALAVAALMIGAVGTARAQQHIGNGVYVCDGAAQAGPCQSDDGGDVDSAGSGGRGGYTDNDYARETRRQKGWRTAYYAAAISLDGKYTGASIPAAVDAYGYQSAEHAANVAISTCESNDHGTCKLIASLPNACSAASYGTLTKRYYVAFVPLPIPRAGGSAELATNAGKAAAEEAAMAECRRNNGGPCDDAGEIGCSELEPAF